MKRREGGEGVVISIIDVWKPQIFDGDLLKVLGFIRACRIYIKNKLREAVLEDQVLWVLSYIQGGSADIWKENVLEELKVEKLEFELVGDLLVEIRKEFRGEDKESVKVAKLKRIEQEERKIEEFVQDFKKSSKRK